jgi:hypothetical protein
VQACGIPINPRWLGLTKEEAPNPFKRYDEIELKYGPEEALRLIETGFAEEKQEFERACTEMETVLYRSSRVSGIANFRRPKTGPFAGDGAVASISGLRCRGEGDNYLRFALARRFASILDTEGNRF